MAGDLTLWRPLIEAPFLQEAARRLASGSEPVELSGLSGSSPAAMLSLLAAETGQRFLVVIPDDTELERMHRDLAAFAKLMGVDPATIAAMEALDADPYDGIGPHPEVVRSRVLTLDRLTQDGVGILLVPARALLHYLPSREEWQACAREIRIGDTLSPEQFLLDCLDFGYRRTDIVSGPSEISRRGGIVDVFPPTALEPVRIEWFGDTVDSLRSFDTDHQRSTGKLEKVRIIPGMESPPTQAAVRRVSAFLEGRLAEARGIDDSARPYRVLLETLENHGFWPGFETMTALTSAEPRTLFDHVPDHAIVVEGPERCDEELIRAHREMRRTYEQGDNRALPGPDRLMVDPLIVREQLGKARVRLMEFSEGAEDGRIAAGSRSARAYGGRIPELLDDLKRAREEKRRTVFVMRAQGGVDRLREILEGEGLSTADVDGSGRQHADAHAEGGIFLSKASLVAGFDFVEPKFTLLTERNVFGDKRKAPSAKKTNRAAFLSDFRDLSDGDMVVHVDHGLAKFKGLGRPKGGSLNRDFIVLEFLGGDRLFVPVDRLDLVQKYSGVGGAKPVPDKLGGVGWDKVRKRARKAVESMAKELLELYAKRKTHRGHAYSPDSPWQAELEDAFPYELTPDQKSAVEAIKSDMEGIRPMDRLLVGDVGFGKTEVSVRAAFKAVTDGRQVAVLAPTTVLALQHFETFRTRFGPFPVRVEMVSRFRSAAENKAVLKELEIGAVDVLIGTHRMISKDVVFKSLGLLVVDEEQRFGVAHKERLKQMTMGVDVLSMTATPIPRTLQMSLAGVRDLSIIETPPPGRSAIQTYVLPFREHVLAQAIRQELRREGQIFFVHNNIETLETMAAKLKEMVPEARILTGHGQMTDRKLEKTMMQFIDYEADLFVTTTIIENGLDIPRANTIVVNRADRFGLAQLYQLRGRVGRSHNHAYAYFVVPGRETLTDVARKRLKALQEFSDLGAGFRLAAADLEIRGAGELLGSKQHGHIAALGFDLYCQMLERAVQEMQGEEVEERRPVTLNLGVDIKVPQTYLPEPADRLVLYKRLAQAESDEAIDRLQTETEDRYGHPPQAALNLFEMGRLRSVAQRIDVKSVELADGSLRIQFHERPPIEPAALVEILARERGSLSPSGVIGFPAPSTSGERIAVTREILGRFLAKKSNDDLSSR